MPGRMKPCSWLASSRGSVLHRADCKLPPCLLCRLPWLQVFDKVAWPAIEPVLQGVSGTVFAYGVTSRCEGSKAS